MKQNRLAARATAWRQSRGGLGAANLQTAVETALAVALVAQAAHIALALRDKPDPAPASSIAGASSSPVDRTILTRFDPFSPPGLAWDSSPGGDARSLRLFGVQVDGARSLAIIAASDGRQVAVAPGETVEPGLVLESVGLDHVVLRRGSHALRLAFDEPAPAGAAPAGSEPRPVARASSFPAPLGVGEIGSAPSDGKAGS